METMDRDSFIISTRDYLQLILNPAEPIIMSFQSLLVWEKPRRSAILVAFIHGLFWFLWKTNYRFYFLVSCSLMILFFIYTWKKKIWPEIRVPPKEPEDTDEWTPVHPRLLSVPEICELAAYYWCSMCSFSHGALKFRKNHQIIFFIITSSLFLTSAGIGQCIPGVVISYFCVLTALLWPCIIYNNLHVKSYQKIEPSLQKLNFIAKIRSKLPSIGAQKSASSEDLSLSSSSNDLEELFPVIDEETIAALSKAICDSDDETGTTGTATPSITAGLSKEPSVLDSEEDEEKDLEPNLVSTGLELPSLDTYLDTDDELLDPKPKSSKKKKQDNHNDNEIDFVPSHYDDSEDSDDERTVSSDLSLPKIDDITKTNAAVSENVEAKTKFGEAVSTLSNVIMTKTMNTMVGSALQGLSALNDLSQGVKQGSEKSVAYSATREDHDSLDFLEPTERMDTKEERKQSVNSSEIDLDDEFDFLDEYDDMEEDEENRS